MTESGLVWDVAKEIRDESDPGHRDLEPLPVEDYVPEARKSIARVAEWLDRNRFHGAADTLKDELEEKGG